MKWILENFQIVVAILATLVYFLTRAGRSNDEPASRRAVPPSDAEREHAERTRRIQEEIRRKIAERRAATGDVIVVENEEPPPLVEEPSRPTPIDPFGGPMRRVVREFEQATERWREPEPDAEARARAAEIARQARLAEEMRALQQQREAEARRFAQDAAAAVAQSMRRAVSVAGGAGGRAWTGRLRDPNELRRAIVLREILGPPVGLR